MIEYSSNDWILVVSESQILFFRASYTEIYTEIPNIYWNSLEMFWSIHRILPSTELNPFINQNLYYKEKFAKFAEKSYKIASLGPN